MIVHIIKLIHLLFIIFLVQSVINNNIEIKKMAFGLLIFLLIKYTTNMNKCFLTQLEYMYLGENYKSGFIYRTITPIVTMPEDYFNKGILCFHLLWIIILFYQIYL